MRARSPSPPVLDLVFALAVTAIEFSDMFVFGSGQRDAVDVALLAVSGLGLVGWRRQPFACLALCGAATIALALRHGAHVGLGAIAATFAVACWGSTAGRWASAALLLVAVWLVPLLSDDRGSIPRNVALFAAAWVVGALLRERRRQNAVLRARGEELARERERSARLAAEAERARIARELHDALTHSVAVMVIQAQGAQAGGDPERTMTALARIERVGRQTLAELRGLLRDEPGPREPLPGLDGVAALVTAVREAGLDVTLDSDELDGGLPASVGLSAYRIVQEALTNVLRHSGAHHAQVIVRRDVDAVRVEIRDDGRGVGAVGARRSRGRPGDDGGDPRGAGDGRGLAGMRERAAAVGGTLDAAPGPGGGFIVSARLPIGA